MISGPKILITILAIAFEAQFAQAEVTPSAAPSPVLTQSQEGSPQLLRRCGTVSLVTKSRILSPSVLAEKLRQRGEFQNANLTLTEQQGDVEVTVTDAVQGIHHLDPIATITVSDQDVRIQAVRVRDGITVGGKVVALGSFEGIVAAEAIDLLHQLCPAVITTNDWRRLGREPLDASALARLREARSVAVISHTSWMDDAVLGRELGGNTEIKALHLTVLAGKADADLRLEVSHDFQNTLTWRYELLDRNRQSLLTGYVGALSEQRATTKIVNALTRQLSHSGSESRIPYATEKDALQGTWQVKLLTPDPRTTSRPLEVSIGGGHLIARNSLGQPIFNIEVGDLVDVEHSSFRDPIFPYPADLIDFVHREPTSDVEAIAELEGLAALGGYTGVAAITTALTTPLRAKQHSIEIAWNDKGFFRRATFQLRRRDAGQILKTVRGLIQQEESLTVAK
jgi:hypothetical protein